MLRVLQVVNIMDRAGIETMLMNYYRHIDRSKIQFDFLTHRLAEGAYDEEIMLLGGRVYCAPRLYPQNYLSYFKFMKVFFSEHPEYTIVHSHIDTMSAFPLYAAKQNGIPVRIAHSHSSKLDKDAKIAIKYLAKIAVPNVANVYCACGERAGQFMYGSRHFKVIHNAIEVNRFQYSRQIRNAVRKKIGLEDTFVIGHVGRYCYIKNQSFLLEVFALLRHDVKNAKLLLIGKGEDEMMLRRKAADLHCEKDVLFLIDRSDVNELYQAMDVFVMPSLFEGLPVVGVEAQANGLPCIMSDRISREICFTNAVKMLNLNESKECWVKAIENSRRNQADNSQEQLLKAGYDVEFETKELMQWYHDLAMQNEIPKSANKVIGGTST